MRKYTTGEYMSEVHYIGERERKESQRDIEKTTFKYINIKIEVERYLNMKIEEERERQTESV